MKTMVFPAYAHSRVDGPPQGQWTYADWEALPDDGNCYEVIEGVLYMSASPSLFHNWIILRFYDELGAPAQQQGLAFAFVERVGVLMPGCEPVQPDFVLVLAKNASILYDRRVRGVPDLIVEVLSPGSADYDEDVKLTAYANAGLPEYGVIDPAKRELRAYQLQRLGVYAAPRVFREGDTAIFTCLPNLPVRVTNLFSGAPDSTL